MSAWRDIILKEFPTQVARLTLVADPDGLLSEEGILQQLQERGFDLLEFDDSIAFRYAYESKYRGLWDMGETTDLVVVLRSREQDLRRLPYDLLKAGRQLSFGIPDIFPNLNYPVAEALGASHFDSLYRAQEQYKPGRMGSNQTADFILLHVFETEPKLIRKPAQLLHFLMRKHYREKSIPERLTERFIQVIQQGGEFDGWPLDRIVDNGGDFYTFLQERWNLRVQNECGASDNAVKEAKGSYGLKLPGPATLPFEHDDVRVYLDNLFAEGLLQPTVLSKEVEVNEAWLSVGVSKGPIEDRKRRLEHSRQKLTGSLPGEDSPHEDWMDYARTLADCRALQHLLSDDFATKPDLPDAESAFSTWLLDRYGSLHNQPPTPPVMVHHIPRTMSAWLNKNVDSRLALLVIDGLAMGQWAVTREVLREQQVDIRFEEQAVFAWIPTLTSISRQSIFSGKLPQFFPESIHTTVKEPSLWKQFWTDRGQEAHAVRHLTALSPAKERDLAACIEDDRVRVLGLVINTIDDIMHGMQLGASGMYNQVEQWTRQGFLQSVLQLLANHGFTVFVASDHGNVEAQGIGNPSEGSIAETRGQRVRIYNSAAFRAKTLEEYSDAIPWPQIGLPMDLFPLLAPTGSAFIKKGENTVSHGGPSLEEVIVPFATVVGGM